MESQWPELPGMAEATERAPAGRKPKSASAAGGGTAPLQNGLEQRSANQVTAAHDRLLNARPASAGGLPQPLKGAIETLSNLPMDDVRVHYRSDKPAQFRALAYAQGRDIHIGAGQERHLPHEAWHVVQQKQGRVKPDLQAKGAPINSDPGLEREADVMGTRAAALAPGAFVPPTARVASDGGSIQLMLPKEGAPSKYTTALYAPRGKTQQYTGGRKGLDFQDKVRDFVLRRAGMSEGSDVAMGTSTSGSAAIKKESVQVDHITAWDTVAADLIEVAANIANDPKAWISKDMYVEAKSTVPSMYAARLYYNDVDNLRLMTGGANASKGAKQSAAAADEHPETEYLMMQVQDLNHQLQQGMQGKSPSQLAAVFQAHIASLQHMQAQLPSHQGGGGAAAAAGGGAGGVKK